MVAYARQYMREIGHPQRAPTILYEDNDACRSISEQEMHQSRAKHMDIKYRYLVEQVLMKQVEIQRVDTVDQLADMFTKALPPGDFKRLRDRILLRIHPTN